MIFGAISTPLPRFNVVIVAIQAGPSRLVQKRKKEKETVACKLVSYPENKTRRMTCEKHGQNEAKAKVSKNMKQKS